MGGVPSWSINPACGRCAMNAPLQFASSSQAQQVCETHCSSAAKLTGAGKAKGPFLLSLGLIAFSRSRIRRSEKQNMVTVFRSASVFVVALVLLVLFEQALMRFLIRPATDKQQAIIGDYLIRSRSYVDDILENRARRCDDYSTFLIYQYQICLRPNLEGPQGPVRSISVILVYPFSYLSLISRRYPDRSLFNSRVIGSFTPDGDFVGIGGIGDE